MKALTGQDKKASKVNTFTDERHYFGEAQLGCESQWILWESNMLPYICQRPLKRK